MKFYFFHLMPWPDLPGDFDDKSKHPSAWVTLSNRYYDPEKGHLLYNRYLDELEYAEKARLRRRLRQRTPPECVRHDALSKHNGGHAGAAN